MNHLHGSQNNTVITTRIQHCPNTLTPAVRRSFSATMDHYHTVFAPPASRDRLDFYVRRQRNESMLDLISEAQYYLAFSCNEMALLLSTDDFDFRLESMDGPIIEMSAALRDAIRDTDMAIVITVKDCSASSADQQFGAQHQAPTTSQSPQPPPSEDGKRYLVQQALVRQSPQNVQESNEKRQTRTRYILKSLFPSNFTDVDEEDVGCTLYSYIDTFLITTSYNQALLFPLQCPGLNVEDQQRYANLRASKSPSSLLSIHL